MKTCIFKPKDILTIYPVSFSYAYRQEPIDRPSGIDMHQIFVVSDGSGVLSTDDFEECLQKGDMFFLKAEERHSYYGDENFKTSFFTFSGEMCLNILKYFGIEKSGVFKSKNYRTCEILIENFYNDYENIAENYALLSAETYKIVTSFFSCATSSEKTPIETVKSYIESHFAKEISLNDIMEFYPHSKAKLCRDFPQKYGMTVIEMLTKTRLEHAKILLRTNPRMTLSQIASNCGFNDTSYFCKTYKKTFGKTPRENNIK